MKIAVCAICRNEINYLDEWISFYKLTGFDSIYIYDNVSDDGTTERLQAFDECSIITRVFWPRVENVPPQRSAYANFLDTHSGPYDFVLICDMDEFLITPEYNTKKFLKKALEKNPNIGAIAVPWLIFGSSGEENHLQGNLVKRFQHCENTISSVVKPIFRPKFTQNIRTHICDLLSGDYVNGNIEIAKWHDIHPHWVVNNNEDGAVLYHYYTKSRQEFIKRRALPKADRAGLVSRNFEEFDKYSSQSRYNPNAYKLNAAIDINKNNFENIISEKLNKKIKMECVDFDNGWFFGVIYGKSESLISINILINQEHELRKKIKLNSNGMTPVSIKLKWASKKANSLKFNINGQTYKDLNLNIKNIKTISNFVKFCGNFPSAEEHIFSNFLLVINKREASEIEKSITNLKFTKYNNHKKFMLLVCESLINEDNKSIKDWIGSNPNYETYYEKLKGILHEVN